MSDDGGFSGARFVQVRGLTERGRRAEGQWPGADPMAALLTVLDTRIEKTGERDQRSKLIAFRGRGARNGQSVATAILTDLVRRQTEL